MLAVPLLAPCVPPACGLTHQCTRRAGALLTVGLLDAKALGLEEDVLREASATLCNVLLVVDALEEVLGDLLIGIVLHMAPMLAIEDVTRLRIDLS